MSGSVPGEPPGGRRFPAWLHEKLFERRIVFVAGRLEEAMAARAAAEMTTLDAIDDAPIDVYLDSPAGTLESAFVLIDTLHLIRVSVRAHCLGHVGGPAIGVLAVADHRSASPHASFRLAQPTAQFAGTAAEIVARSQQQQELLWRFQALVAKAAGRPADEIIDDMRRGRYLDAREALDYGLIDAIATKAP